ncbi:MAG TPA: hypothetical protein VGQ05_17710 [Streptosporangiaceae bacterium]|jgi:hypothetical protein|nr:hypothetical protein [Streptosporangiaceae bacterium]
MFVVVVLLAGVAVALLRRHRPAATPARADRGDAPARLLGWATGLLDADRADWGQAMLGELDRLDGRAQRWRFAAGCSAAAMMLPPWGRAAAAAGSLAAVAAGGLGLFAFADIHYGLGRSAGTWVFAAIVFAILAGYLLAGGSLLRRPGVAGPGLAGGLFVAAAWLAVSGWTFDQHLGPLTMPGALPLLVIAVPAVVGAGGTLWSGSAAAGRRVARLAAVSAGLGLYLYGALAVAAVGAGGPPGLPHAGVAGNVSDRLGNEVIFALIVLPLATATVGWAAAAATARLRWGAQEPALAAQGAGPAAVTASRPQAAYLLLMAAVLAAAAFLGIVSWLR